MIKSVSRDRCVVEREPIILDAGPIIKPDSFVEDQYAFMGRVKLINVPEEGHPLCKGSDARRMYRWFRAMQDEIIGKRVLLSTATGTYLEGDLFLHPIASILAILSDDYQASSGDIPIPRCQLCGPAGDSGQGVMMNIANGVEYCPRCNCDKHGKDVDHNAIAAPSRDEKELFTRDMPKRIREKVI